jgi:hypothetical protein
MLTLNVGDLFFLQPVTLNIVMFGTIVYKSETFGMCQHPEFSLCYQLYSLYNAWHIKQI